MTEQSEEAKEGESWDCLGLGGICLVSLSLFQSKDVILIVRGVSVVIFIASICLNLRPKAEKCTFKSIDSSPFNFIGRNKAQRPWINIQMSSSPSTLINLRQDCHGAHHHVHPPARPSQANCVGPTTMHRPSILGSAHTHKCLALCLAQTKRPLSSSSSTSINYYHEYKINDRRNC